MDDLMRRLGAGEEILLIEGPDDICAPWIDEATGNAEIRAPHCHEPRITGRDQRAAADIGNLLGRSLGTGSSLRLDIALLAQLRKAFHSDAIRSGCGGCEWKSFCDDLSAADFAGCRLSASQ
jgi:hypothetical protein